MRTTRIAIIGAGMTGLICARRLIAAGARVTVFEKSGDIGGRLASRRRMNASWNHGAPQLQPQGPAFREFLEALPTATLIKESSGRLAAARAYEGYPDMRELLRPLTEAVDIRTATAIDRLSARQGRWHLYGGAADDGTPGEFDVVLFTQPAPQAEALLQHSGIAAPAGLQTVRMHPTWVLLLGFREPVTALARAAPGSIIEQVIAAGRPHPGNTDIGDVWVVHAQTAWSTDHLEDERDAIRESLLAELATRLDTALPQPVYAAAHRWRYARATTPLGRSHLWDAATGLGFAGDWCLGGTAEDAFHSGEALGQAVAATIR